MAAASVEHRKEEREGRQPLPYAAVRNACGLGSLGQGLTLCLPQSDMRVMKGELLGDNHIDCYRVGCYALHVLRSSKHDFSRLAWQEVAYQAGGHAQHTAGGIEKRAAEVKAVGARAVVRDRPVQGVETSLPARSVRR